MGIIRILLAIAVVLDHCTGWTFIPGNIAVESFFMISGFYMSLILNEKYIKQDGAYKLFISNRFLRLFPTYWLILALTVIFSVITYNIPSVRHTSFIVTWASNYRNLNLWSFLYLAFANVFLFFQDITLFLGLHSTSGSLYLTRNFYTSTPQVYKFLLVPQAWSIALELVYYLIAPWLIRRPLWFIILLICLSLSLRLFFISTGMYYDPWNYRFFPAELLFFLSGAVAYKIYKWFPGVLDYDLLLKTGNGCLALVVAFILSYGFFQAKFNIRLFEAFYFLFLFTSLPLIFIYTKNLKTDRMIGDLSYPVYMVHMLIIGVLGAFGLNNLIMLKTSATILSIIAAIIINKLIIERIDRYRQKRFYEFRRQYFNAAPYQ